MLTTPDTFTSVVAAAVKVTSLADLFEFKVSTPVYVVVLNATPAPLSKLIVSILEIVALTAVIAASVFTFKTSLPAPPSKESILVNVCFTPNEVISS